jgi:hypothetical protein
LRKKRFYEVFWHEGYEIVHPFANSDELDRNLKLSFHGYGDSAARRTIELGEHNARNTYGV